MTHGSLFSGIGGFDLAAEWMGWENIFHCEWNPFGQKVLKYYWPEAISYNDITKTDFTIHRGSIDILTGGFPCQPYSTAGKRLGKEDDRHLWPSMLRAIREIQPRWVVGENVLGLVNWSGGLVFHEVQVDLEAEGYEVQPFVLAAAAVNAPHRRDRVWFVAHAIMRTDRLSTEGRLDMERPILEGRERNQTTNRFDIKHKNATDTGKFRLEQCETSGIMGERQEKVCGERNQSTLQFTPTSEIRNASDTNHNGLHRSNGEHEEQSGQGRQYAQYDTFKSISNWEKFPTVSAICDGNDGISYGLDGITFSKWRQESIKAGGNAVVPQVVYQIFKTIQDYENLNT